MEALRRLVASLVTATLLLAGPLGIPRSCVECPPGCPMHAQIGAHGSAKKPGCHRMTAPSPAGTTCLRGTCGHEVTTESGLTVLALLASPMQVSAPAPGPRIAPPPLEPRLRPPRTAQV
jgi:hypothetical protein